MAKSGLREIYPARVVGQRFRPLPGGRVPWRIPLVPISSPCRLGVFDCPGSAAVLRVAVNRWYSGLWRSMAADPGTEVLVVARRRSRRQSRCPSSRSRGWAGQPPKRPATAYTGTCSMMRGEAASVSPKAKVEVIVKKSGICTINRTDWDIWSVIKRSPFLSAHCFGTEVGSPLSRC